MADERLVAVLADWWENGPVQDLTTPEAIIDDVRALLDHLTENGYEIRRRPTLADYERDGTMVERDSQQPPRSDDAQSGPHPFGSPAIGGVMPAGGSTTWPETP